MNNSACGLWKKLWGNLWESRWENGGKVSTILRKGTERDVILCKSLDMHRVLRRIYTEIYTGRSGRFSLFYGRFCTVST